jgi:hypothetical protein
MQTECNKQMVPGINSITTAVMMQCYFSERLQSTLISVVADEL